MSDTPQGPGWWMAADEKWYPPEDSPHAHATTLTADRFAPPSAEHAAADVSNDAPVARDVSAPPESKPGNKRMIVLVVVLGLILAGLVTALAVTALGSDDSADDASDVTTSSQAERTSEAPAEDPAVDPALTFGDVATTAGTVKAVDTIDVNGTLIGLAALVEDNPDDYISSAPGAIRTWTWEGGSWVAGEPIPTEFVVDDWIVADVTGDGVLDLVVELFTGNGFGGAVLTAHSGRWVLPEFRIGAQEPSGYTDSPLRWDSSTLTSDVNTCEPSCADGNYVTHAWTYDANEHIFTSEEA